MQPFEPVLLGGSGVTVTRLGMGLAPIGGLFTPVGERAAAEAVDAAWRSGVRFFDTAPAYGAGLSERRSGRALAGRDRDAYTLATKVGRPLVPGTPDPRGEWAEPAEQVTVHDFTAAGVRRSLRASLDRLGLGRVDVVHLHDPDDHYAAAVGQALPVLTGLRRAGEIGAVSAGMKQSAMLTAFAGTGLFDCFLLAGRYTLLDQSGLADLLPECARRGISVIAAGVYNSGVLADPSPGATFEYRTAPATIVAKARAMQEVCARYGVPLRAAAVQFPFGHPAVASVLVGMRSAAEVADAVAMASTPIPGGLWRDLVTAGLLDASVPVP